MEKVLEQALPQVTKTIEPELPLPPVEPPNNNLRDAGIVIGVLVAAAVCARLYEATSKRK